MTQRRRRFVLRALGVFGLTGLAGCSETSDTGITTGQPSSDETATTAQSATATRTATPTRTPTATLTPTTTETPTTTATPETQTPAGGEANFAPADGARRDRFGYSIDISGDGSMTLVGAYRDGRESGGAEGSAYLFTQVDGTWVQQAKLTPDAADSGDYFGFSVGISGAGSTAIIGARRDDNPVGVGAGYIFTRTDDSWAQQAKLTTDDTAAKSVGKSVGISSDGATVVVGADATDEPNGANAGSAYVFARDGSSWTQETKLLPGNGDDGDAFGRRVAISGDGSTVLVSAPEDGDPNGEEAGSASVFTLSEGAWTRQAKLAPADGQARDQFGSSLALSRDGATVIAAAPRNENTNGIEAGSAYVFSRENSSWTEEAKLRTDDGEPGDLFGSSVALSADGGTAFLGAKNDENANGRRAGAVYEFTRTGEGWSQQTKLTPENGDAEDLFGFSVDISDPGSITAVGVPWDEDLNGQYAGSAYVFE